MSLSYYCTVAQAREELRVDDTAVRPIDDTILYNCIRQASQRFDIEVNHTLAPGTFEPSLMTMRWHLRPDLINSWLRTFQFSAPLLELTAVTASGATLTVGTDVIAYPPNEVPTRQLQLVAYTNSWYQVCGSTEYANPLIEITGRWGYHWYYTNAWQDSGDSVQDAGGINATVTSITVTDADGTDYANMTPRFSPGNLIRIESEYLRITAVDTGTNTLTVQRGLHGTTAAAHALDTQIDVYYPDDTINRAVARQAGMLYKRRGAFDEPTGQLGGLAYPVDLLSEVRSVLQQYVWSGRWQ